MLGASVLIFFIVAGMLFIFMYHTPHFVIALRGYEGETNKRSSPRFSKQRQGWGEALSFLVMMPGRTVELHHVEKVWVSKNEIKVELVVIVQLLSHTWLFATPWTIARQASLPFTISQSLLNSCPLSRWCHPSISPSVIRFFSCPQSFPESGSESCGDRWNKASSPWFQSLRSPLPPAGLHCLWGLDRPHFPSIMEAPLMDIFPIIPLLFWR